MTLLSTSGIALAALMQAFEWPRLEIRPVRSGPVLGTAADDERTLFTRVRGAHRFRTGQVLVADAGNARLVLFSRTGVPLWTSGRLGDGPGEYRYMSSLTRCDDGPLAVLDANQGRITLLSDSGTVLGTRIFPGGQRGRLVWCRGDQVQVAVMWRQELFRPQTEGPYTMPVLLLKVDGNERIDTLASGENSWFAVRHGQSGGSIVVPLTRPVSVSAAGKTAWLCEGAEGRCSVHDLTSGARDTFSVQLPRRPLTTGAWNRAIRDTTDGPPLRLPDPNRSAMSVLESLKKPDRLPTFERVHADAANRLWIRTYERYGTTTATWLVVTRKGKALATVHLPSSLTPLQIGPDFLLGLTVDSDGVEQVSTYTFKPFP